MKGFDLLSKRLCPFFYLFESCYVHVYLDLLEHGRGKVEVDPRVGRGIQGGQQGQDCGPHASDLDWNNKIYSTLVRSSM